MNRRLVSTPTTRLFLRPGRFVGNSRSSSSNLRHWTPRHLHRQIPFLRRLSSSRPTMAHMTLPADLPVPEDDGACVHLEGMAMPSLSLPTTAGGTTDLGALPGLAIIFLYPRTAPPDEVVPDSWNAIPGARGCTPQACSFRDQARDFSAAGVGHIFGVSTQDTEYQQEVRKRLHLPYELISDHELQLQAALRLPTFEWKGKPVLRRVSMAVADGRIVKVWYPVFPPDKSADQVLDWLRTEWRRPSGAGGAPSA